MEWPVNGHPVTTWHLAGERKYVLQPHTCAHGTHTHSLCRTETGLVCFESFWTNFVVSLQLAHIFLRMRTSVEKIGNVCRHPECSGEHSIYCDCRAAHIHTPSDIHTHSTHTHTHTYIHTRTHIYRAPDVVQCGTNFTILRNT